ncbi:MAG: MauE/DoxX family redox-associated membrane protein [Acidimicrobiales bacterium]
MIAHVAAALLAVVLTVAAVAKLVRPRRTRDELAGLGLVASPALAVVVPVIELTTAALLVVRPAWGGVLAFALITAFTAVLVQVIRSGRVARCACFGSLGSEVVSRSGVIRNGLLLVLAVTAATGRG